jgi:olfactory receptor
MICENHTRVTEFILLGFTNNPGMQIFLFILFLAIYTVTLMGNFLIVTVTSVDPVLQTSM